MIYVLSSMLESCMLGLILVMINLVRNLNLQLSIFSNKYYVRIFKLLTHCCIDLHILHEAGTWYFLWSHTDVFIDVDSQSEGTLTLLKYTKI